MSDVVIQLIPAPGSLGPGVAGTGPDGVVCACEQPGKQWCTERRCSDTVYLLPRRHGRTALGGVKDTPEAACGAQPQASTERARSALMA
jgi:hypothetical protein